MGDARLAELKKILAYNIGCEKKELQGEFHDIFLRASLPLIYGAEWDDNTSERVMRDHAINEMRPHVFIRAPRRRCKSGSIASFVAAILQVCPDLEIHIHTMCKRTKDEMLRVISYHMQRYTRGDDFIRVDHSVGVSSSVAVLTPSDSTRGHVPMLLFVDETAYTRVGLFYDTVVPLFGVRGTACIGIGTPCDDEDTQREQWDSAGCKTYAFYATPPAGGYQLRPKL